MESHQQVQMGADHAEVKDEEAVLSADYAQQPVEKPGTPGVDERCPTTRCPNDVGVESLPHSGRWNQRGGTASSKQGALDRNYACQREAVGKSRSDTCRAARLRALAM